MWWTALSGLTPLRRDADRLQPNAQPASRRPGVFLQGSGRGLYATAFEARNGALGGAHAAGDFRLGQVGLRAGLDQGGDEVEFLPERLIGVAVSRIIRHAPSVKIARFDRLHDTSFARCRANSSSRCGVFWVFFTKILMMTTRCREAVT